MQEQRDLKRQLPTEVTEYMRMIGRRGAAKHSLSHEARQLGVSVRKLKRQFITKGYGPDVALDMARSRLHLGRKWRR
jgi:methylphosphotriester-DNA--protein-cysteine methyltransferase